MSQGHRILVRVLAAFVVGVSISATLSAPAYALSPPAVVSASFARTGPNVGYEVEVNWPGDSACDPRCTIALEWLHPGDLVSGPAWEYATTAAKTVTFSGATPQPREVSAYRVSVYTYGGTKFAGDWVAVEDSVPSGLSAALTISRDGAEVDVAGTVAGGGFGINGPCQPYTPCRLYIEGGYADGGVTTFNIDDGSPSDDHSLGTDEQFELDLAVTATKVDAYRSLTRLRAAVSGYGGVVYSDWVPVNDVIRQRPVRLIVNEVLETPSGFSWDLEAKASGLGPDPGMLCTFSACQVYIEAKRANGSIEVINGSNGSNVSYPTGGFAVDVKETGNETFADLTHLRASVVGANGSVSTAWIPASTQIVDGHDFAHAADLLLEYVVGMGITGATACTAVFPVGTHTLGSSANDQQLSCSAAVSAGTLTMKQIVTQILREAGGRYLTSLLATLGIQVAQQAWLDNPGSYYVPPVFDTAYENNQIGTIQDSDVYREPEEPAPGAGPSTLVGLSENEVYYSTWRECVSSLANIPDISTGLSVGQMAGVDPDECATRNVFFSGSTTPESTAHDLSVVQDNPALTLLSYVTNAEKGAGPAKPSWDEIPACEDKTALQQCDEFPFYSTEQGFPAFTPSYLPIRAADNTRQGGLLAGFYNRCPSFDTARGSDGRNLIFIPLRAELQMPTFSWCGG